MFLLLDEYYKSNHSCFLLQYHLVLVTKYHHPRLTDGVKNILLQYARSYFEQCDCIIQEALKITIYFACAADGPARTAPKGHVPLESPFPPAGGIWYGCRRCCAVPAPPEQRRVVIFGRTFRP